jgi:ABC-2 type transport system ATP-binding protein
VTGVTRAGAQVVVTGTGNVLHAVTAVLARNQIIAAELRVEQTTLDDAFLALTGRALDS